MWIAVGALGGAVVINWVLLLFTLLRVREVETIIMIVSSILIGGPANDEVIAYLKARGDHPAGKKKGERLLRRMDERGS